MKESVILNLFIFIIIFFLGFSVGAWFTWKKITAKFIDIKNSHVDYKIIVQRFFVYLHNGDDI